MKKSISIIRGDTYSLLPYRTEVTVYEEYNG